MVHRLDWIPANIDDGSDILMLNSISKLIKTFELPDCPVCMKEKIRFYYTISDFQPDFVTKKGQVRGTVWVWCPHCLHWTHGSHIHLSKDIMYINRLSRPSGDKYCLFKGLKRSENHLNKQANNFSFIRSKFLNP